MTQNQNLRKDFQGKPQSTKGRSPLKTFIKWTAIAVATPFVLFVTLGIAAVWDGTPEDRARWEQERLAKAEAKEARQAAPAQKPALEVKQATIDPLQAEANDPGSIRDWGRGVVVRKDVLGERWPFPQFDAVIVRCKDQMVTIGLGGMATAANGEAMSRTKLMHAKEFAARDEYGHLVYSIDPLVAVGVRVCE